MRVAPPLANDQRRRFILFPLGAEAVRRPPHWLHALVWSLALAVSGCASPTSPTPQTSRSAGDVTAHVLSDWTPVNAPCNEATVDFHDVTLGHAVVTNRSQCDNTYTLIAWEFVSETEQRALAYHTMLVPAGHSALLSIGFAEKCGQLYQRDVYMNLPPIAPGALYTLSDVANAVFWATGELRRGRCGGGSPPSDPPSSLAPVLDAPPPVGQCARAAFAQIDRMEVSGGRASIALRLRAGYDNITVYLLAYGSATLFPVVNGRVVPTFPQTLIQQAQFVIRAGAAQTISIAIPPHVTAYQIDAGCVPGPLTLHNRQSYPSDAFLEAAVGNNP